MTEDLAVWRGNAKFDQTDAVDSTAATSRAQTWSSLSDRVTSATDDLYALEAAAPDNTTAAAARGCITAIQSTRQALDARAEARYAYRTADAQNSDQQQLNDARDREVRASRNLADSRSAYAKALTDLSAIV